VLAWAGEFVVVRTGEGTMLRHLRVKDYTKDLGPIGGAKGVALASDGVRYAYFDGSVLRLRTSPTLELCNVDFKQEPNAAWSAFSHDGNTLVSLFTLPVDRMHDRLCLAIVDAALGLRHGLVVDGNVPMGFRVRLGVVSITPLAVSWDGGRVAFPDAGFALHIIDARTGKPVAQLPGATAYTCAAFFPDGRLLTGSESSSASIWAPDGARLERRFLAHDGFLRGVAVSTDGKRFATASLEEAKVWRTDFTQGVRSFRLTHGHHHVVRDGPRFVLCSATGCEVFDPATGELRDAVGAESRTMDHREPTVRVEVEDEPGTIQASARDEESGLVAAAITDANMTEGRVVVRAPPGERLMVLHAPGAKFWRDVAIGNGVVCAIDSTNTLWIWDGRPLPVAEDGG
jgi:hypothetical protein